MIYLKQNDVVAFAGDSITDGNRGRTMDCNHLMGHGYQYLLAARMAAENLSRTPRFINKGYSGENICQTYARWSLDILQYKPAIISLLIGINDVSQRTDDLPDSYIAEKYERIYRMLLADTKRLCPDAQLVLCEPFFEPVHNQQNPYQNCPHPMCEPFFRPLNADQTQAEMDRIGAVVCELRTIVRRLAGEYGCIFVPFQDIFTNHARTAEPEYLIWDGVHPTLAGHSLMAARWYDVVDRAMR